MKIKYSKQFIKDVKKYSVHKKRIYFVLSELQKTDSISNVKNLKKLHPKENDFRLRIGDFRIGLSIIGDAIVCRRFLHRKDIYKYFP